MSMYIKNIHKTEEGHILSIELRNEYDNLQIYDKWDGRCNIHTYSNRMTPDDEVTKDNLDNIDYIHICELQEFINNLQEVVNLAKENFNEDDFEGYWA